MKTECTGTALEAALQRHCMQAGELQEVCLHALAGGSRTRANLLLRAAEREDTFSLRAASALEMMHAATLLQDDIFDRSAERRGRRAAYLQFGEAQAVLASDWLLLRSLELAAEVHPLLFQQLACAARTMASTVAKELHPPYLSACSEARAYIDEICQGKTASLFAVALYGAALLQREPERAHAPEWAAVGNRIGYTYQLLDDCLDVYAPAGSLNKSTGVDLQQGRLTLPLLTALESLPSKGQSNRIDRFRKAKLTATEMAALQRAVENQALKACMKEEVRVQMRAVDKSARMTAIPHGAVAAVRSDMEAKAALCFDQHVRHSASAALQQHVALAL